MFRFYCLLNILYIGIIIQSSYFDIVIAADTPTDSPTASPSDFPTFSPSHTPTIKPSAKPSRSQVASAPSIPIDTSTIEYYSFNTADAYTWKKGYPQSCVCKENGVKESQCTTVFQCQCNCDVTAGECDYNCCCDPDCSDSQIARFSSLGECNSASASPDFTTLCYSSVELQTINPHDPMEGQPTSEQAIGQALCVYKRNYISQGNYYTDTDMQPISVFSTSSGQKIYEYIETTPTAVTPSPYYDLGDTIPAYQYISGGVGYVSSGSGSLSVPVSDDSGWCSGSSSEVLFETDVKLEDNTCARGIPCTTTAAAFEIQCLYQQSVDTYVTNLWISKNSSVVYTGGSATATNTLNAKLTSITYESFAAGALYNITQTWNNNNCRTQFMSDTAYTAASGSSGTSDGCDFETSPQDIISTSSTTASLSYTSGSSTTRTGYVCRNVVKSVNYIIKHYADNYSGIYSITADIVVTDIPYYAPSTNSTSSGSNNNSTADTCAGETSGCQVQWRQSFGVSFISDYETTRSDNNGNIVTRPRSGNPGYLLGSSILYGTATTTSTTDSTGDTVNEYVSGLTVPSPLTMYDVNNPNLFGQGICPSSTTASQSVSVPIKFGYDMISSCVIQLTRSDLRNLCDGSSEYYSAADDVPYYFADVLDSGYLGIYGNADPLDITQWLSLPLTLSSTTSTTSSSSVWSETTGTCSNILSSLNYQFLIAKSGEKSYPQNKIVSAVIAGGTSDWMAMSPYQDNITTHPYQLTITVSFIYTDTQELINYAPPSPPILFKIPTNAFYPFYQTSDASVTVGVYGAGVGLGVQGRNTMMILISIVFIIITIVSTMVMM